MKMRLPRAGVIATLVALLAMAGGCTRFGAMKGPIVDGEVNRDFVEYVADKAQSKLELSDQQRARLQAIVEKLSAQALEQRKASQDLKGRLVAGAARPELDPALLDEAFAFKMDQVEALYRAGRDELIAFHATLNPQQRAELAKLIAEHPRKGGHCW